MYHTYTNKAVLAKQKLAALTPNDADNWWKQDMWSLIVVM
jgi:hypothetical protein